MNDNEQRDELAEMAYRGNYNDRNDPGIQPLAERSDNERRRMYATANAILAAGYSKPRTITTVEELDALPNWSAILDDSGDVAQKLSGWWHFPETSPVGSSKVLKYSATVTVIHEPTTEATP